MEPDSLTRRNFLKLLGAGSVAMLSASLPNISGFGQRPTVRVITFAQGFAWPELFGSEGATKTDRLKEFEAEEGVNVQIEWGDETTVRQKVATDLAAGTGRFDILLAGSDGGVQTYGSGGFLESLDEYLEDEPTEYFDPDDVYQKFLDANRMPPL
ncbi:MAG: extracellular solute-binding protein [Candidatus Bipolaricaulota bacterium]